jgi:hypothetical protein
MLKLFQTMTLKMNYILAVGLAFLLLVTVVIIFKYISKPSLTKSNNMSEKSQLRADLNYLRVYYRDYREFPYEIVSKDEKDAPFDFDKKIVRAKILNGNNFLYLGKELRADNCIPDKTIVLISTIPFHQDSFLLLVCGKNYTITEQRLTEDMLSKKLVDDELEFPNTLKKYYSENDIKKISRFLELNK